MNCYTTVDSPLGTIVLTCDGTALTGLYFEGQRYEPATAELERRDGAPVFATARQWLGRYFGGLAPAVEVPLAPRGTPFQLAVWEQIGRVARGETISYAELARRTGRPAAVRAAAAATGRNPIALIIPCHRIVGSDGSLTGYAGGLQRKRALLALEARG